MDEPQPRVLIGRSADLFWELSAHADGERPGATKDPEGGVGKVSVRRIFRHLQIGEAPRRSPSACSEMLRKKIALGRRCLLIGPCLGIVRRRCALFRLASVQRGLPCARA